MMISDLIQKKPDLYIPFWAASTLIFSLFVFGFIS